MNSSSDERDLHDNEKSETERAGEAVVNES